jgi:hypothetical protein
MLEAFALGAGIPQSVWCTVPVHKDPVINAEVRIKDVILRSNIEELNAPLQSHSEEGNLDEQLQLSLCVD